jgi:hypothetical protein
MVLKVSTILLSMALCLASFGARSRAQSEVQPVSDNLVFAHAEEPQQQVTPGREQLRVEHLRVLDRLNEKDASGKVMELDDPRVPELVRKGWGLAGAWAAGYLETHLMPSTGDLNRIFADFAPKPRGVKSQYGDFLENSNYSFRGSAVRVGPSTYVVLASYGFDFRTGTFMIVARNGDGHFRALWNIKDLAEKHYAQRDEIGRWMQLVRRAYYNGPLDVEKVLRLSPSRNGHPRFMVDAYQGADGGTTLAQLSIWEWDGVQANPLMVEVYHYSFDFRRFHFDGRTLKISTKEELDVLDSCGQCTLPKGTWTVRIAPGGIHNLGHRFLQPEIRWADEVLSTISKGEDATNLADAKALDALRHLMQEGPKAEDRSHPSRKLELSLGLLEQVHVLRRGHRGAFVLLFDEGPLRFDYVLRSRIPYFTSVKSK